MQQTAKDFWIQPLIKRRQMLNCQSFGTGSHQMVDVWGIEENTVTYFPSRQNQWCCDGTKPNPSFLTSRKAFSKRSLSKNNERLMQKMVAKDSENTSGHFLPSSSLGFYSNASSEIYWSYQTPMSFENLDHDSLYSSPGEKDKKPGFQPLISSSPQSKASPEFQRPQSLGPTSDSF